jgi:ADP-heptose:LPS heptosyltransferase
MSDTHPPKPKLLVIELWALGDLAIATPFLQVASEQFAVTLLAKPHGRDLAARLWPRVNVVPFIAPWTAFRHKYRLLSWPWNELLRLRSLRAERFEVGLSGRWDPRDHFLLRVLGARKRFGFPRAGSQFLLTNPLPHPGRLAHRYEQWRTVALALGLELPARGQIPRSPPRTSDRVMVHTGAGRPLRVWPLARYRALVEHLRLQNYNVLVACDPDQESWWQEAGETKLATPRSVTELIDLLDRTGAFIGNDSGAGHLAAILGVPTFTLFGPQLSEWFAPLHPASKWLDGGPCPYKPCSDYCRFPAPNCLLELDEPLVCAQAAQFLAANIGKSAECPKR